MEVSDRAKPSAFSSPPPEEFILMGSLFFLLCCSLAVPNILLQYLPIVFNIEMLLLFSPFFTMQVTSVAAGGAHGATGDTDPFSPKASLIRYWNRQIGNGAPKPAFLMSKASPLNAVDAAAFSKLAARNALSDHLPSFCAAAGLLCFPDLSPSLKKHGTDSNFAVYSSRDFSNYRNQRLGGLDSFKKYSEGISLPVDSFRRYSRAGTGHDDKFDSYGSHGNAADQRFNSYGVETTGGTGEFHNYNDKVNVPHLNFNSYGTEGIGRANEFSKYTDETNHGDEKFTSYGRNGNGSPYDFKNYATDSNVMASDFSGYGERANGANDSFTSYGVKGNVPENTFMSYGSGGNGASDSFANYRDQSNVGDDSFRSYAKGSSSAKVNFASYGKSFNEGTDKFSLYGQGAKGESVGFKVYGININFKDYANKSDVSFARYTSRTEAAIAMNKASGSTENKWIDPGKFFRESTLKEGNLMPMPDIRDKMPRRSFLPRAISSKLPFSSTRLAELKRMFHAGENSSMESMIVTALEECERAPSRGETKRCVGSIEDMLDFATSLLGRDVTVRSTENVAGSGKEVLIGRVAGVDSGKVTESVSCHQSLYPYLLYYCHSIPKVRVYEADLLDPSSKALINHGVAICHLDTSAWSPSHGAFRALGYGPGWIEVCHWIFENDMTWTRTG
ncbi:hypothetical protein SAY87_028863 [Trapa incisa]|uniref:BURP domain-containing protein n=1 Tax=Trapa incisa TaxID=236973 RepID=A0AAN7KX31_9MYRT|nr:hypothetical protein SAY87_028863 [Trapa incisa]